jgi:outer membrane protein assembly factor BamB
MKKRRWWKWFLVSAGAILCIEACMLMVEPPDDNHPPLRYRIMQWFDDLFAGRPTPPTLWPAVAKIEGEIAIGDLDPVDVELRPEDDPVIIVGKAEVPAKPTTDWPMFGRTLARNMADPFAKNVPTDWSVEEGKRKNVKWMAELGSKAYGGPVIADGKVFFGTNNTNPRDKKVTGSKAIMMCFAEADGKFLWQTVHEIPPDALFNLGRSYGLCSTPCVEGKRHYYQTPGCDVICADNDTGKVIWRHDLMAKDKVIPTHLAASSPLIVDDLVMVVTGNGVDEEGKVPSPAAPSFIALNKNTGTTVWLSNLPGKNIIEGQWSNPAVAVVGGKKQVIFPGGDCWLYSFEPATGKLLWKCNCNPQPDGGKYTPYIVATPVVQEQRCYVGLGCCPDSAIEERVRYGYLVCVDVTKSGDVSPKSIDVKDPANKGSALVWSYGGPINPRPKKGRRDYFGRTMSTCAVHGGLVYAAEFTGFLHCFDARTGEHYWEDDLRAGVWGSPSYLDGRVYIGTEDAQVLIYAHGKKRKQLAKIEMDQGIHGTLVWANGVLYVPTLEKLYAIEAKK